MTVQPLLVREELGTALRDLRVQRGMSLRELAHALDDEVTAQAISRIELGQRSPKVTTLVALSRALGVSFVVGGKGVTPRNNRR